MIKTKHRVSYFTEGNIIEIIYDKRKLKKQIKSFIKRNNCILGGINNLTIRSIYFKKINTMDMLMIWLEIKINNKRCIYYVPYNKYHMPSVNIIQYLK